MAGLLGQLTPIADITRQLLADGRFMPVQKHCYLDLALSVFYENINLISFSVCSGVDRLWRL
jgi:hypothetical protein